MHHSHIRTIALAAFGVIFAGFLYVVMQADHGKPLMPALSLITGK